jgi:signal transduction histidine kinase/CheY-like chemotaxis protein
MPTGLSRLWFDLSLSRKGVAMVALPVLCIFGMLGLLAYLQRLAEAADQWVVHGTEVLGASQEIVANSLSLEATVRGYRLTREPAFLDIHRHSRVALFDAFDRTLRLTGDNTGQRQHILYALGLMREEMAALDSQIAAAPSAPLTDAVQASRHRIDLVKADIDAFAREERRLLEYNQTSRLARRGYIRIALIFFAVLGVVSGIVGARLFTSGVRRRLDRIAANAVRVARRESGGAVDGSADAIGRLEVSLIGVTRDLLDRKARLAAAAVELERAKEAAEATARAKSDFVATISHEIRSPMNALLGAAEMLGSTPLTGEQAEYVALLNRAGANLLVTVNEVLDHAKIEAGQLELERLPFDCAAAVDRVAALLSVSAKAKGLDLLVKYTPETPRHVTGDSPRLQRVLLNLVSNAIKFTEQGIVAIRVAPAVTPGMIQFSVADSGIGIPADRQEAIFERYVQAGASTGRTHGGTGLGLAIARHIVGLMGGRIWVESAPGEGSTFHFTASLPRAEAPAPPKHEAAPVAAAVKQLGGRLLLAEDAVSNVALVKAYLAGTGCEIDVAPDGIAALERLQSGRYTLALMDVQMPGLDGYEVTRRFRDFEREHDRPRTPIVSVTAHAFEADIEEAIKSGADAHLTKPFRREELLDVIELYQRPDGIADIRVAVPEFVRALAPEFLRRQRYALFAASAALRNGEFDPVRNFGHNMKGCGKSFGFPRLTDLGREIEQSAEAADAESLRARFDELREYLTAVDVQA